MHYEFVVCLGIHRATKSCETQWPVGHLASAFSKPSDEKVTSSTATPELDLIGHLTSFCAALRSVTLGLVCIYWAYSDDEYPGFGRASEYSWSWIWPIVARNVIATWVICGFWDWFLYFGPLKEKLHKYRFEQRYPSHGQVRRSISHEHAEQTVQGVRFRHRKLIVCVLLTDVPRFSDDHNRLSRCSSH